MVLQYRGTCLSTYLNDFWRGVKTGRDDKAPAIAPLPNPSPTRQPCPLNQGQTLRSGITGQENTLHTSQFSVTSLPLLQITNHLLMKLLLIFSSAIRHLQLPTFSSQVIAVHFSLPVSFFPFWNLKKIWLRTWTAKRKRKQDFRKHAWNSTFFQLPRLCFLNHLLSHRSLDFLIRLSGL